MLQEQVLKATEFNMVRYLVREESVSKQSKRNVSECLAEGIPWKCLIYFGFCAC